MTDEADLFGEPTLGDAKARGRVARVLGKPCNAPASMDREMQAAWNAGWCEQDVRLADARIAADDRQ